MVRRLLRSAGNASMSVDVVVFFLSSFSLSLATQRLLARDSIVL